MNSGNTTPVNQPIVNNVRVPFAPILERSVATPVVPATPVNQPIVNDVRVPLAPIREPQVAPPVFTGNMDVGLENIPPEFWADYFNELYDELPTSPITQDENVYE